MGINMLFSRTKLKRSLLFIFTVVLLLTVTFLTVPTGVYQKLPLPNLPQQPTETPGPPPKPIYKPISESLPPIVDNFPRAASANSSADLPPVPKWNAPPDPRVAENTPLFIGFTRNWRLLQQTVVSYITGGWPPSDIYVVENTGTMFSNRDGLLTLQNPFYLDHHRLTAILGVNVISTPTLLTFAQLQNFFVHTALDKGWEHYFWSHMDVVAVSDEEYDIEPYQSLYMRAVEVLRETLRPEYGKWAARWFAYDRLSLIRTEAYTEVGGWDTMIPFYMTDCDMHERLFMKGFKLDGAQAAKIWDVSTSLDDLELLYRRGTKATKSKDLSERAEEGASQRNSPLYQDLLRTLDEMQHQKSSNTAGRNTWQARQRGGQGEPFYRDPEGFEKAIMMTIDFGRKVFEEKWGRGPCNLREAGLVEGDAWKVMLGWETPEAQAQAEKDQEQAEIDEAKKAEEEKHQSDQGEKSGT